MAKTQHVPIPKEEREFLRKARYTVDVLLRIVPVATVLLGALAFFIIWQPLSDIRKNTDDLGKLSALPAKVDAAVLVVEGMGARIKKLEALPEDIANLAKSQRDGAGKLEASIDGLAANAKKQAASVDMQLDGIESRLGQLEKLPDQITTLAEVIKGLEDRVSTIDGRIGGRRLVVSLPLKRSSGLAEAGEFRGILYEVSTDAIPALGGDYKLEGTLIESPELRLPPERTSDAPLSVDVILDTQNSRVVVTVWTTAGNADALARDFSERGVQVAFTLSWPKR